MSPFNFVIRMSKHPRKTCLPAPRNCQTVDLLTKILHSVNVKLPSAASCPASTGATATASPAIAGGSSVAGESTATSSVSGATTGTVSGAVATTSGSLSGVSTTTPTSATGKSIFSRFSPTLPNLPRISWYLAVIAAPKSSATPETYTRPRL